MRYPWKVAFCRSPSRPYHHPVSVNNFLSTSARSSRSRAGPSGLWKTIPDRGTARSSILPCAWPSPAPPRPACNRLPLDGGQRAGIFVDTIQKINNIIANHEQPVKRKIRRTSRDRQEQGVCANRVFAPKTIRRLLIQPGARAVDAGHPGAQHPLRQQADCVAPRFHQPHGRFVEGHEGISSKPASLIGDDAIGEVATRLQQSQSGFRCRPVHHDICSAH